MNHSRRPGDPREEGWKGTGKRPSPSPTGAEATRERLLAAGRRLFAELGFDGTSVRALTEEAGVNLGAVTYHFRCKEGLYYAVLDQVLAPMRSRAESLRALPVPALQRLELFVRGMFQQLRENPDMPRFMVQEVVLGESPAPPVMDTVKTVGPILIDLIREGQAAGAIRDGDPVLFAMSVLSQPIYLTIMPPVLRRVELRRVGFPQPRLSPEDHAVEFVLRGLRARQEKKP